MKIKTSELIGPALDWAVACIEYPNDTEVKQPHLAQRSSYGFSRRWEEGGPIIEREIGNVWKHNKDDPNQADVWTAASYRKAPDGTAIYYEEGPTPLIAAMRCFVASELGDEIEIPKEILNVD